MLTEGDAVAIYEMKLAILADAASSLAANEPRSLWGKTREVSKRFGVNTRTIKYIWNHQTWTHATQHLWPQERESRHFSSSMNKKVSCGPCVHDFSR